MVSDEKMYDYDVVVNCVMWDTNRTDRIIYKDDLKKFKPGTLFIDVSCNICLEIETSRPMSIDDPVYEADGKYSKPVSDVVLMIIAQNTMLCRVSSYKIYETCNRKY